MGERPGGRTLSGRECVSGRGRAQASGENAHLEYRRTAIKGQTKLIRGETVTPALLKSRETPRSLRGFRLPAQP